MFLGFATITTACYTVIYGFDKNFLPKIFMKS